MTDRNDPRAAAPRDAVARRGSAARGVAVRAAARRRRLAGRIALALAAALVLGLTGYAWASYRGLVDGLQVSDVLNGQTTSSGGDTNILIMGLDSRLDENGNPLPKNIYDALHAGDQQNGGYNANVLMLLHVPGNGAKATSISIPRDDYVSLSGCPDNICKGKIKQAYGLAFDEKAKQLTAQHVTDKIQREQQARDAGRRAEIDTVRQFLGGVPIDHFAEVTLVAFFEIAQVVQPVTVCVNENTQDSYSGANFHAGQQQIDAEQAVAFVRQRRDYAHPSLNFTDLDRERRQQAFIASLAYQLKQGGAFTNPTKLQGILDVAKQNTAVDSTLDLLSFAKQASSLTGGDVSFVTLPVDHFGKDPAGEDVNFVNQAQIQATVAQLLGSGGGGEPQAAPAAYNSSAAVVDVVNSTARGGLAAQVEQQLRSKGYAHGTTTTSTHRQSRSTVYYPSGESSAANAVAGDLGGLATEADANVPPGHVRVVLGADYPASSPSSAAPAPPASGQSADLPALSGGGIPCVK
ncbi:LCP family protein [Amycolatopsis benzoatilytica]|uniref:LCP family protein n=1 Tax=Amycolatopsis benzoatilytica TaxID=346045 RepID=UPI0003708B84|nr:LCP family protein [Amycolatopsis benzoatilytica]